MTGQQLLEFLQSLTAEQLQLPINMQMDRWAYNPCNGNVTVSDNGIWMDAG